MTAGHWGRCDCGRTGGDWANQQRVQLDQRAEGALVVAADSASSTHPAGRVPQLQAVVGASLQQQQAVRQQQRLDICRPHNPLVILDGSENTFSNKIK